MTTVYYVSFRNAAFQPVGPYATLLEAHRARSSATDCIVAYENGKFRPLNPEEEDEYQRIYKASRAAEGYEYPSGAHIEFLGGVAVSRYELTRSELREIGKFTRGNVLMWMESHRGPDWVGMLPVEDFHAVCGDIDIPWATEHGRMLWMKIHPLGW
jgi:hypothetical protein